MLLLLLLLVLVVVVLNCTVMSLCVCVSRVQHQSTTQATAIYGGAIVGPIIYDMHGNDPWGGHLEFFDRFALCLVHPTGYAMQQPRPGNMVSLFANLLGVFSELFFLSLGV